MDRNSEPSEDSRIMRWSMRIVVKQWKIHDGCGCRIRHRSYTFAMTPDILNLHTCMDAAKSWLQICKTMVS